MSSNKYQSSSVKLPFKFIVLAIILLASFYGVKMFASKAEKGIKKINKNPRMETYQQLLDE